MQELWSPVEAGTVVGLLGLLRDRLFRGSWSHNRSTTAARDAALGGAREDVTLAFSCPLFCQVLPSAVPSQRQQSREPGEEVACTTEQVESRGGTVSECANRQMTCTSGRW